VLAILVRIALGSTISVVLLDGLAGIVADGSAGGGGGSQPSFIFSKIGRMISTIAFAAMLVVTVKFK
jgi:hypothetical protein